MRDRFCAHANDNPRSTGRWVHVKLTPVNGVGPSHEFTDRSHYYTGNTKPTCRSLATAYEDTRYKAVVSGGVLGIGLGEKDVRYFYS